MIVWMLANAAAEASLETARHGARIAGQFSPINTILGGSCLAMLGLILRYLMVTRKQNIDRDSGLRSEFIAEMANLRKENGDLREQIAKLHHQVFELHGVINAMRQSNISAAEMVARNLHVEDQPMRRALDALDQIKRTD